MSLIDNKITAFSKTVAALADKPSLGTTALLKQWFDSSPEELRVAHNNLIDFMAANYKFSSTDINIMDYGASGLSTTAVGSITSGTKALTLTATPDFVQGQGINLQGALEASSLQVTAPATVSSNVTVTLNGVAFLVAVASGDTAIQVATKIRAATYAGWTAGGTAGTDTVTFTSLTSGVKTDATYSAGTTGATGTMTTTTQGTADQISTVSSINGLVVNIADNATRTITAGTISHDDTAAIQAAVNAAQTNGNKVWFPPGKYYISSVILITDINIFIFGSNGTLSTGRGTKIYTTSQTDDIFKVVCSAQSIAGITFKDIQLMGNALGTTGNGVKLQTSVAGKTISFIRFDNVSIQNCKEHGLMCIADNAASFIFSMYGSMNHFNGNGKDNIHFEGNVSEVTFNHTYTANAGNNCIKIVGTSTMKPASMQFNNLIMDSAASTYYGAWLEYCDKISINDIYTESMPTGQVYLKSVTGIRINGGRMSQTGTAEGVVIDTGTTANQNIFIDIPGWTTTSSKTLINMLTTGGSYSGNIWLGSTANGPINTTDILNYATIFLTPSNSIFFAKNPTYTTTYDPPSIANGSAAFKSLSVERAALGNQVIASFSLNTLGVTLYAYVQSAGIVNVAFTNNTGGAIDLGSGTLTVELLLK